MLRTTLRGLLAHKLRLASTALAILLGVAFMTGSFVLTDTLGRSLDSAAADAEEGTDAYVRGEATLGSGSSAEHGRVDASLASTLADVDGVAAVAPRVEGYAQVVGPDGEPVGDLENGAPPLGSAWTDVDALNAFALDSGEAPRAADEVVVDRKTATDADIAVGDRVRVLTREGPSQVTVTGVATFGDADSAAGASTVLFTPDAAVALLAEPGRVDGFAVAAEPGVSQGAVTRGIESVLPAGTEALTGAALVEENAAASADDTEFFSIFMTSFAVVALFVGAFIINNTFAITVAQRMRELALLRAIGASARQVRTSVTLESLVVGVVASAAGLVAGVAVAIGLRSLLEGFGLTLPEGSLAIVPTSLALAFGIGVLVTLVSAVLPARRASRIPPMAALHDVAVDTTHRSPSRAAVGLLLAGGGVAAVVAGVSGAGAMLVGVGAFAAFLGVAVLGPVMARPVVRVLGAPLPRLLGVRGRLARENAARNPRRTAATAAALMVGVGLVGSVTAFAASGKQSVTSSFDDEFRGDYRVESGAWDVGGFSPRLADDLAARSEIAAVTGTRLATVELGDGTGSGTSDLSAWDASTVGRLFDLGVARGSVDDLGTDGLVATETYATDHGWTVGSTVPVRFGDGGAETFTVRALTEHGDWTGALWTSTAAFDRFAPDALDTRVYARAADGVPAGAVRQAVDDAAAAYPNATVQDRDQQKEAVTEDFNSMLGLVYALLALAILIALLGIANTLALSVVERTRELGLVRAVGMSRAHVRAMVRWEAALVAVFGTLTGLAVGLFLGWSLVYAVAQSGIEGASFVVPYGQLAAVVLVAAAAGVLAAVLPARRAARLDVLAAVASE